MFFQELTFIKVYDVRPYTLDMKIDPFYEIGNIWAAA